MDIVTLETSMMRARALVLHDLESTGVADPASVSTLEAALAAGSGGCGSGSRAATTSWAWSPRTSRTPCWRATAAGPCAGPATSLEPHALYIHPDLGGPDPTWVCEHAGIEVAPVGGL